MKKRRRRAQGNAAERTAHSASDQSRYTRPGRAAAAARCSESQRWPAGERREGGRRTRQGRGSRPKRKKSTAPQGPSQPGCASQATKTQETTANGIQPRRDHHRNRCQRVDKRTGWNWIRIRRTKNGGRTPKAETPPPPGSTWRTAPGPERRERRTDADRPGDAGYNESPTRTTKRAPSW